MPQLRGSQCSSHRSACLIRALECRQAGEGGGGGAAEGVMEREMETVLNEVSCVA